MILEWYATKCKTITGSQATFYFSISSFSYSLVMAVSLIRLVVQELYKEEMIKLE